MKVALGFAVLAFGGTALAARTGSLPPAAQERAHAIFSGVGVPAPEPSAPGTPVLEPSTQPSAGGGTTAAVPSSTPAPGRTGSPAPSATATADLCRVWEAARRDPPGQAVPAQTRRALAAAAGGVPRIDDYCAGLLGRATESAKPGRSKAVPPGQPSATPKVTPGRPDKTKSKGSENGNGNGNGKGSDAGG